MYHHYLLHEAATHLYTLARMYDTEGNLELLYQSDPDIDDTKVSELLLNYPTHTPAGVTDKPILISVNDRLIYACIPGKDHSFLLGPVCISNPVANFIHRLSCPEVETSSLAVMLALCNLQDLADDAVRLYNSDLSGENYLSAIKMIESNCSFDDKDNTLQLLHNTIFDNVENGFVHNPYAHEKLEVSYVRSGNTEALSKLLEERFPGRYGRLSRDPIRQEIYLGIVAITIACRAAIDAGLHPETAFYLSDISIQRLDVCRDPNEIIKRTVEAEIHFAEAVRDLKKEASVKESKENHHISKCKDYIFTHLHGKITVRDVADAVGLEPNYLSSIFKKYENVSMKNYITTEKIRLAANLLVYSEYSYSEISSYLGFASQSHMGMEFKRIKGMTPGEYRSRFANEDFMQKTIEKTDTY